MDIYNYLIKFDSYDHAKLRPVQFDYVSYGFFGQKKVDASPKKIKIKSGFGVLRMKHPFEKLTHLQKKKKEEKKTAYQWCTNRNHRAYITYSKTLYPSKLCLSP